MRTLGTVLGAAALSLGLAACGTAQSTSPRDAADPAGGRLFGDCAGDDPALGGAAAVAEVDLDGDGTATEVRYLRPGAGGPCAGALVATIGGTRTGVPVTDAPASLDDPVVVDLQGSTRELLMVRGAPHPRGGYPVHLYGAAGGAIEEVLADGRPVVGFVATDGGAAPATATCTPDGGLATWTGTAHQPPGVVLAWDVWRTTYSLDGATATEVSHDLVREAVADPLLRKAMPQLFDPGATFADCRAG